MKIWLGAVDREFNVNLLQVNRGPNGTHDENGIDGDYCFRVVDDVIFWWHQIPDADIKEAVIDKLRKKTRFTTFSHAVLRSTMPTFRKRYFQAHGYNSFLID